MGLLLLLLREVLTGLVGWLLFAPWVALLPRRKDWMAVIGKQDGMFHDNTKYFFLQAAPLVRPKVRIVMVTERLDVVQMLADTEFEVLRYPSWRAVWLLLRSGTLVVDEAAWYRKMRRFLLIGANKLQLWHGVGFKRVEIDAWRHAVNNSSIVFSSRLLWLRLVTYFFWGRLVHYDAISTTSDFYRDEVFQKAFWVRQIWCTGYPRNDFAQSLTPEATRLAWGNVDTTISRQLEPWRKTGRKVVLIAPTFRESGGIPMELDASALEAIDIFCDQQGVDFVFKFHPFEKNIERIAGRHLHVCARDSDIYPLFPYAAALVTDYSSISMDFLLTNKPICFFIPDGDDYTTRDRQLQFDPRTMMPGPMASTWQSLLAVLATQWMHDDYVSERAALRAKAFDDLPQSAAAPKLLALMREEGWLVDDV